MYSHNATVYPMLGVGAFVSMFWTGVVVADALGLGCISMLIMGLLSACIASVGVCELQRRDGRGLAAPSGNRAARPASPEDRCAGRRGVVPGPPPATSSVVMSAPGQPAGASRGL